MAKKLRWGRVLLVVFALLFLSLSFTSIIKSDSLIGLLHGYSIFSAEKQPIVDKELDIEKATLKITSDEKEESLQDNTFSVGEAIAGINSIFSNLQNKFIATNNVESSKDNIRRGGGGGSSVSNSKALIKPEDKIAPELKEKLEQIDDKDGTTIPIIIEVNDKDDLKLYDGIETYESGNLIIAQVPLSEIDDWAEDSNVEYISTEETVEIFMTESVSQINSHVLWNLGFTGNNITIAILDTGINKDHPILKDKIIDEISFLGNDTSDLNGHGTQVAGIASGKGSQEYTLFNGVAPDSKLINIKVLDENGKGSSLNVIRGIDYAVRKNADIILIPFGTSSDNTKSPINKAVEHVIEEGIVVVAAAGNCGEYCPASYCKDFRGIGVPGNSPNVITVGAVDKKNTPACFSPKDEVKPDVVAPGVNILTASSTGFQSVSGTSASAPHIAGVVALLLEKEPTLTPLEIKDRLIIGSIDIDGSKLVDVAKVINTTKQVSPVTSLTIPRYGKIGEKVEIILETIPEISSVYYEIKINDTLFMSEFMEYKTTNNLQINFVPVLQGLYEINFELIDNLNYSSNFSTHIIAIESLQNITISKPPPLFILNESALNESEDTVYAASVGLRVKSNKGDPINAKVGDSVSLWVEPSDSVAACTCWDLGNDGKIDFCQGQKISLSIFGIIEIVFKDWAQDCLNVFTQKEWWAYKKYQSPTSSVSLDTSTARKSYAKAVSYLQYIEWFLFIPYLKSEWVYDHIIYTITKPAPSCSSGWKCNANSNGWDWLGYQSSNCGWSSVTNCNGKDGWVSSCDGTYTKKTENRNYYCSSGKSSCQYSVSRSSSFYCPNNDGWYCKDSNIREYRSYRCSSNSCTYTSSSQKTCPWGCSGNKCNLPPCFNECNQGDSYCSGKNYYQCGNYDSDSCLEYGNAGKVKDKCGVQCTQNWHCGGSSCGNSFKVCLYGDVYEEQHCTDNVCTSSYTCIGEPRTSQRFVEDCQYGCDGGSCIVLPDLYIEAGNIVIEKVT